ncbi:MAG: hypothetical protein WBC82_02470 [Dehalococcoidia bacterium]
MHTFMQSRQPLQFSQSMLANARVTVYPSLDRAAKAIANMNWYYRFHRGNQ